MNDIPVNTKCVQGEFNITKELYVILDELRGTSNNLSDVLAKIECPPCDCVEAENISDIKTILRAIRQSAISNNNMSREINSLL